MEPVRYHIDASDRLVSFNEGWTMFARENSGEAFLPPLITGRSLWEFITESTTAHIYHVMIGRVRNGHPPIRFEFRCDSPDRRRFLQMVMTGRPDGGVEFHITSLREEPRPRVPLLDTRVRRGDDLILICAWCKRARLAEGGWVEIERAVEAMHLFQTDIMPGLTHGMCERCQDEVAPMERAVTRSSRASAE